MAVVINGTTGIDKVQDDTITSANLPAGSVLQVVDDGQGSQLDLSSISTWTDTGTSVVISPSSTSSKVLISVCMPFQLIASSGYMRGGFRVLRDSTVVWNTNNFGEIYQVRNANNEWNSVAHILKLDSPATTSSTTYKVQCYLKTGDTFRIYPTSHGTRMVLQEIAG